jgi:cytochrome c-type biogenesis protein
MTLSPDGLTAATSAMTPLALAFAAFAGLGAAFGPSTYPLIPAVLGYGVTRAENRGPALVRALWIVFGMVLVDAVLGAFAGAVGEVVARIMGQHLAASYAIAAVIALVLGLRFLRVLRFRVPAAAVREAEDDAPWWEPFVLGLAFGVAACPACTPLLLAVLLGAAAVGKIWFGAALLGIFALARGLPLLAVALSANMIRRLRPMMRFGPVLDRAGGWLLIATSAYFFYLSWFVYAGSTGGMAGMPGM